MTDFAKIKKELKRLGWLPFQGKGDHIKFRHPENPTMIVVNESLDCNGRAFKNMIGDIRKIESRFSLYRPAGWVYNAYKGQ